ncbi:hypothetical protein [Janthinobacterium sp. FW305-128]|nr:hypothetical protein [Janthinobacterium sp. FW305-128]
MSEAMEYLEKLITDGVDYPDAEFKTSVKFDIDANDLRADYDRQ